MTVPPLIPAPVEVVRRTGSFRLDATTEIRADSVAVGEHLAGLMRPSTGFALPVTRTGGAAVELLLGGPADLGDEGYQLDVASSGIMVRAHQPAGLYRGVQTLRQLLPPAAERRTVQRTPWEVPGIHVRDTPRFAWRGLMLDVARHFFGLETLKRVVDLAALYKVNTLHLHLTDDQGWRIAIDGWPDLAAVGGRTQVGGGTGGYYTKAEYAEIVDYAAAHHVTVVPEIDVPGHTNAALVAYPELACDGRVPEPFTGTEVGFSSLCPTSPATYRFCADVFGELAAMTPGPYLHLGGDEVRTLGAGDYARFAERAAQIVAGTGKRPVGWQEIAAGALVPGAVVQYWDVRTGPARVVEAVRAGAKAVLSPADRAYLDMKYGPDTRLGLNWAGYVDVQDSYDWDPVALVGGLAEDDILGVEAALWTETVATVGDLEYMLLPRLPAVAEVAWSAATRDRAGFTGRLAAHGPRWEALGARFHRSPQVPWRAAKEGES